MDIVKSKQMPADDLQKVMSDLAKDKVAGVEVGNDGIPANITPPPPPPGVPGGPTQTPKIDNSSQTAPTAVVPATPNVVSSPAASSKPADLGDLNSIKLDAVEMLKPLIGSLDISPEEKFEAMIEIIRASDDQEMISQAFGTAKAIQDNDKRAQALIDIINEINYINKVKQA